MSKNAVANEESPAEDPWPQQIRGLQHSSKSTLCASKPANSSITNFIVTSLEIVRFWCFSFGVSVIGISLTLSSFHLLSLKFWSLDRSTLFYVHELIRHGLPKVFGLRPSYSFNTTAHDQPVIDCNYFMGSRQLPSAETLHIFGPVDLSPADFHQTRGHWEARD